MQRTYNTFYPGVKQDDFLTAGPSFIEHKNVDGLRDGYGITLGPKVNKGLTTGTTSMIGIDGLQSTAIGVSRVYCGGDNGVIYKLDSTDDTPEYTLINGKNIVSVVKNGNDLYFFYKTTIGGTSSLMGCAYITESNASSGNWTAMNESFIAEGTILSLGCPPILVSGTSVYVGGISDVYEINSTGLINTFTFPDSDVLGLTLQGATIVVYCESGIVYFWDGGSVNFSSRGRLGTIPQKTTQISDRDFITTEDGQLLLGSGYSSQKVTKPKQSYRMEDNSVISERLKFVNDDTDFHQNKTILAANNDVFIYASDTIKGLYRYGSIIPGVQKGLHKIVSENNAGTQIDFIYDMFYYERNLTRLYFSYKAGSTYGIDYIDLSSLETTTDGYIISDVFSGGTSLTKKINAIRIGTSNTSGTNTITLSYRVNNGSWETIRTISETTDVITVENIHRIAGGEAFKKFIDIQFKVDFHSDNGDTTPPVLHELMLDYDVIEV